MRFDEVPKPSAVEARPRDPRGYPVPAITPWADGQPQFALTDHERSATCARRRLCSVCGTFIPRGPVWRVVGATETGAIAEALAAGRPYRNLAPTPEGPGHRSCMLYASMVCPYLARPNARRGLAAAQPDDLASHVVRGAARGASGAVAGFAEYEFAITPTRTLFRFLDVVEFLPHDLSEVHLPELRRELAAQAPPGEEPPPPVASGGGPASGDEPASGGGPAQDGR